MLTNRVNNWKAVYQFYETAKRFFSAPDNTESAKNFVALLEESLDAHKVCILIKDTDKDFIWRVDEQLITQHPPEAFLDCLPLLYSSISCTHFSPKEISTLLRVLEIDADPNLEGAYFALESGEQFSVFFIFLINGSENDNNKQRYAEFCDLGVLLEELSKSSWTLLFGDDLNQQLKERQKRQSIWLESLAWLNDFGARQFTIEDLEKFYNTASFQLRLLVDANVDVAFRVVEESNELVIINENAIADSTYFRTLISKFVVETQFEKNKMVHIGTTHSNLLEGSDLADVMLFPLFFGETLKMVLCVAKKDLVFDEQEKSVALLFAEGVGHILERWNFRKTIEKRNQLLQAEKQQQEKLIQQLQSAQDQLLQQEKMASIGQLAAGVAHEINNPVGYVNSNINSLEGYLNDMFELITEYEKFEQQAGADSDVIQSIQKLKKDMDFEFVQDDIHDLVKESKEGISRVKQIVKDLKDFSHVDEAEWQWADLVAGIKSTLNIVHNEVKYKAEVILELDELPSVECVPSQINQVVMNMLVNASHAIPERGTITVSTRQLDADWVMISLKDTGKGIAPENIPKLFDPFFTTKPVGQGTGLGLSLSYSIIEKHGGDIQVDSTVGEGTTFMIKLPIKQKEAKAE